MSELKVQVAQSMVDEVGDIGAALATVERFWPLVTAEMDALRKDRDDWYAQRHGYEAKLLALLQDATGQTNIVSVEDLIELLRTDANIGKAMKAERFHVDFCRQLVGQEEACQPDGPDAEEPARIAVGPVRPDQARAAPGAPEQGQAMNELLTDRDALREVEAELQDAVDRPEFTHQRVNYCLSVVRKRLDEPEQAETCLCAAIRMDDGTVIRGHRH